MLAKGYCNVNISEDDSWVEKKCPELMKDLPNLASVHEFFYVCHWKNNGPQQQKTPADKCSAQIVCW